MRGLSPAVYKRDDDEKNEIKYLTVSKKQWATHFCQVEFIAKLTHKIK